MDEQEQGGAVVQEQAPETKVVGKKSKASGNVIADIAAEVEGLTKTKALHLANNLAEDIETNYFKLGGVLNVIRENTWYEGYATFEEFVISRFEFKPRKARYLMDIYTELVTKQIPWEVVAPLGWTKLSILAAKKVLTVENAQEWVEKGVNLTVKDLQAMLAPEQAEGTEGSSKTTDNIVVKKFKLVNDQVETVDSALAKIKGELNTEYDNVALEMLCAGYLGGSFTVEATQKSLKEQMQEAGWEAAITLYSEIFPDVNLTVEMDESKV